MATDTTLTVGADASAYTRTLKDVVQNTEQSLGKIGLAFMGVQGLSSLGAQVRDAFAAFMRPAAVLEDAGVRLGVLMGNREEADALAASLRDVAVNGVVSFDALVRAAQPLTNVFDSGAEIGRWVKAMADISAATELPVEQLARMVSRIEDMGRAEFTELANRGVPIFSTLAEVIGCTADEVRVMGTQGKITGEQLLEAFARMTAEGGKFYRMNAERSNSTSGSWDTLKASVEACMAELGKPVNDAIRPLLQELATWLQDNRQGLKDVAAGVGVFAKVVAGAAVQLAGLCTNVHVLSGLAGVLGARLALVAMKQVPVFLAGVRRMAVQFKASMVQMQLSLSAFRLSTGMTGRFWASTWAFMVGAARSACVAIKAQIISTGVGLILWGVAEGIAAIYSACQEGDMEQLKKEQEETAAALKETEAAAKKHEAAQRELEKAETTGAAAGVAAERERAEALKATEDRVRKVLELERERAKAARAEEIAAMGSREEKLAALYADAGFGPMGRSKENIEAEMERIRGYGELTTEADVERYKELCELLKAMAKVEAEAAATAKEKAEVEADALKNYRDRMLSYGRARLDARREAMSLPSREAALVKDARGLGVAGEVSAEAIRARLDEVAKAGAKSNEEELAGLERLLAAWDKLVDAKKVYSASKAHQAAEFRIAALEAAGQRGAAARLREDLTREDRVLELQGAGATAKEARAQAEAESKLRQATALAEQLQAARVTFVQSNLAAQGGGGASLRLGGNQLQEAKLHSKLMKDILNFMRESSGRSAGAVAVLA